MSSRYFHIYWSPGALAPRLTRPAAQASPAATGRPRSRSLLRSLVAGPKALPMQMAMPIPKAPARRLSLPSSTRVRFLAPALLAALLAGCGPDELVLARVGDSEITDSGLQRFVDRLPDHLVSDQQGVAADRDHLESLVDQELLLLEARSRGLDTTSALARQMEDAERAWLSRRYQRQVIAPKVEIGPKEVERAFHDMGFDRERLLQRIVLKGSEAEARAVFEQLESRTDYDELAREYAPNDPSTDSTGTIGWVGVPGLKRLRVPQGEFLSLPVGTPALLPLSQLVWQIIRFAEDREAPIQLYAEDVRKLLYMEQWWRRTEEEIELLRRDQDVRPRPEGVRALIERTEARQPELTPEQARQPLFTWAGGGPITAADFVDRVRKMAKSSALSDSALILSIAERELLYPRLFAFAARQRGWHQDEAFDEWRAHTRDGLLVDHLMQTEVEDHLVFSEEEVRGYFEANRELFSAGDRARIEEVHTEDEDEARGWRGEIEGGATFAEILRRPGAASHGIHRRGGEMVLQRHLAEGFPELVEAAFSAPVGEVLGPLYLEKVDSHAILRVLEREGSRLLTFEEASAAVAQHLRAKERDTRVSALFESLRSRYGDRIQVFEDRLEQRHAKG